MLFLFGCSGEGGGGGAVPGGCPAGNEIGGTCAGVPAAALCDADTCADGVSCASVVSVSDDASLASAAASASAGTCIALAPGSYGDVSLPGGVSLLGRRAGEVSVKSVALKAGASGGTIRGIEVGAGGVAIEAGSATVAIQATRIANSAGPGLVIGAGASADVAQSEVVGSALHGVSALDAASVSIKESIISGSKGPGIWAQCATGCDCAASSVLSVSKSILRDNKVIGLSLVGVSGSLQSVDVRDNTEAPNFKGSGGISVSGCGALSAEGVRVLDNSYFGVLVDNASASIGGPDPAQGVEISRNFMGVWVQNVTEMQPVKLEGLSVTDNEGVGLGATGEARGIICWNSAITGTKSTVIPVIAGGKPDAQEVGDGLAWTGGSQMQIDGVRLGGNARSSVLIDGAAADGSSISNLTLEGGDELKGIVQQNVQAGAGTPTVGAGAPSIMSTATELFAVPVAPAVPTGG